MCNTQHKTMKELNKFREFLNEGTWSYGSENQMIKALEEMNAMMMHSDPRQLKAGLDAMDNALYRIFGDDNFHDEFSNAKSYAAEGDLDRAKNALGDAMAIGKKMIKDIHGMEDGLEENDSALDEIIDGEKEEVTEAKVFDNIDMMLDKAAVHMSADEVLQNLVGEFQIISGGTQILNMALKNIMADAGLMEENDTTLDEIIGEQKESLTKQIMKKYPKKYKDEQAVKDAAKELMKNPKFKAKGGIGPVLQSLLKGK